MIITFWFEDYYFYSMKIKESGEIDRNYSSVSLTDMIEKHGEPRLVRVIGGYQ